MTGNGYSKGKEIGSLEADVKGLKEDVGTILTNHLPHVYERLGKIENRIAFAAGGLALLQVLIKFIK